MSSTFVVNGKYEMIRQPQKRGWKPREGFSAVYQWKGPKSLAYGLEAQLRAGLVPYETVEGYRTAIVTAVFGADPSQVNTPNAEQPVSIWEKQKKSDNKTLYEHPSLIAALSVGGSSDANLKALKKNLDNKSFVAGDYASQTSANSIRPWFDVMARGTDSFSVEGPVLVFTRTVSTSYDTAKISTFLARKNVGKIISVADMKDPQKEGAPEYLVDTFAGEDSPAYTSFGYLKNAPVFTQVPGGKLQIVNQYEGGAWVTSNSVPMYKLAIYQ